MELLLLMYFSFHPRVYRSSLKVYFSLFLLNFLFVEMGKKMTLSCNNIFFIPSEDDFVDQKILSYYEICSFDDNCIQSLKSVSAFSESSLFKPFIAKYQPDFISSSWVCFPEYPFSLGLKYLFSRIIFDLFEFTKISFIQSMPILWRILFCVVGLN